MESNSETATDSSSAESSSSSSKSGSTEDTRRLPTSSIAGIGGKRLGRRGLLHRHVLLRVLPQTTTQQPQQKKPPGPSSGPVKVKEDVSGGHRQSITAVHEPASRRSPAAAGSSGRSPSARSDDSGQLAAVAPPPPSGAPGPSVETTPFDLQMAMDSIPDWPPYLMNESDFDAIFNQEISAASKADSISTPPKPNPDGYSGLQVEFLGLSSDMDPFMLQMYKYDDQSLFKFKELAVQMVQKGPIPCQLLVSPETLYHSRRAETGTEILNEEEARAMLEPSVSRFLDRDWPNPAETPSHLLAALYAITLPFTLFDDCLNVDTAYDLAVYPDLFGIINTALSYYMHTPNIAIVQTLLLLVLRPSNIHTFTDAAHRWALLGTLTSHAVTIGLHQDADSWIIPAWQVAQRRRLSFLILAADRWLSCGYGKPPHIHEDNWIVTALEASDRLGCGLDEDKCSQVIQFSSLTGALGCVLFKL
ncbi:hypothetical protein PG994_009937 [Apiospora phragmitis]|uniref:Xylanolytic transcriptional activator regulatory domain-containing protein n=1 Tax=Apiospora phragmitis TaxID=2905665 RepID=A0ABR1TNP3_9PEZI